MPDRSNTVPLSDRAEEQCQSIFRATLAAAKSLESRVPDFDTAFKLLAPYRDLVKIEGLSDDRNKALFNLYNSIMGDAYREAKQPELAADWYRRASDLRRDGVYIDNYIETVLTHELTTHYEHALVCLRENRRIWKQTHFLMRACEHVVTWAILMRRPWLIRPYRSLRRRSKGFESALQDRIASLPATKRT